MGNSGEHTVVTANCNLKAIMAPKIPGYSEHEDLIFEP